MIIGFSGIIIISFLLGTIFISVLKGRIIQSTLFPGMLPFELSFQADGLSILMALIGFLLWSAVFVYSLSNIDKDIIRYHTLLLLLLGGVQGTLFAKDLISFYFFLEISVESLNNQPMKRLVKIYSAESFLISHHQAG